ncbi:MAG TPA: FAD-binding oxidoreductase [Candidatus Eisenbacteria bacterium]|jgi:sarcosine oxidase subunit beta
MTRASVAVIGAGVMGASASYHLARSGWRDILLLDRSGGPGEGSTGRATGGFRAQFGTTVNVRLSLLAREALGRFEDEIGADPGYVQAGYLWLAQSGAEREALRAALRVQHESGLTEAAEIGLDEIGRLNPALDRRGILSGAFCPTDGFIRPLAILKGYLDAAARLGVRIEWNTEALGMRRGADGRIVEVETSRGTIAVGTVVNAAGPWGGRVGALAEASIPVTPLRRQAAATVPGDLLPEEMPMTIYVGDGFHLRVRDGRILLLRPTPGVPGRPFEASVDPAWVDDVVCTARERVPVLRDAVIDHGACWAGLYEMSPDHHALLGPAPECPNLYLINGSSGHGVMHAPALGLLLAEIMTKGRAVTLDVEPLSPGRFARSQAGEVTDLL